MVKYPLYQLLVASLRSAPYVMLFGATLSPSSVDPQSSILDSHRLPSAHCLSLCSLGLIVLLFVVSGLSGLIS